MPEILYFLVAIPLIVLAWFVGHRHGVKVARHKTVRNKGRSNQSSAPRYSNDQLAKRYFQGINHLLNEQPDQAIDVFIQSVEVTPQTLETHLALGNLMRQRGEVEGAIKVHQNLLSRIGLNQQHLNKAHLELARDYLKAGLFDRAERLFLELVSDSSGEFRHQSLHHLVQIYRHEREWEKAIRAAEMMGKKLFGRGGEELTVDQAHFCCELAEQARVRGEAMDVRRHLKSALKFNKKSARANMLWADYEMASGHYRKALKRYRMIPEQQPDCLPEILTSVRHCYEHLDDLDGLIKQYQNWFKRFPGSSLAKALAEAILERDGTQQAEMFLAEHLNASPSIKGIYTFLDIHMKSLDKESSASMNDGTAVKNDSVADNLSLLKNVLNSISLKQPDYRCVQCGFKGAKLHWLCPQCERWETVKPIRGVAGE